MKEGWQKTLNERDKILALLTANPNNLKVDLEVNKQVRKFISDRESGVSIKERLEHGAFFFDVSRAALKSHANFTFDTLLAAYAKSKRTHHPSEMMLEEILDADNAHALERIIKVNPWANKWTNKIGGWEPQIWKRGSTKCYNFLKNKNPKELLTKQDFKEISKEDEPSENYIALLTYSITKAETSYQLKKNVMAFLNQVPWLDDYFASIQEKGKSALFFEDILFSIAAVNMDGRLTAETGAKTTQEVVELGSSFLECVGKRSGIEKWEQKCLEVLSGLLGSSFGFSSEGYAEALSGVNVYLSKKLLSEVADNPSSQQKRRAL